MLRGTGVFLVSCADALGVEWTIDLSDARKLTGDKVALQGNMDPCIFYSNPDRSHLSTDEKEIDEEVGNVLASFSKGNDHVFNNGLQRKTKKNDSGRNWNIP